MARLVRESGNSVVVENQLDTVDSIGDTAETAYQLQLGITAHGLVNTQDDADWFALEVIEGQEYTLTATGFALFQTADADNSETGLVRSLTSSFGDDAAELSETSTFTATFSGTHYIQASSLFSLGFPGQYSLSVDLSDVDFRKGSLGADENGVGKTVSVQRNDAGTTVADAVTDIEGAAAKRIVRVEDDSEPDARSILFDELGWDVSLLDAILAGNSSELFVFPDTIIRSDLAEGVNGFLDFSLSKTDDWSQPGTGSEFLADAVIQSDLSYDTLDSFRIDDDSVELFLF